jgi:fumarate reductase subunit D
MILTVICGPAVIVAAMYCLWLLFLVYSAAANAWRKILLPLRLLLLPLMLPFALLDVVTNLTLATIAFAALPPCLTAWEDFTTPLHWSLTWRLHTYLPAGSWRSVLARWICGHMLDPFQQGHCE